MKQQIQKFWREEDGITALEYGVLAAIITAAVVVFAGNIKTFFGDVWNIIQGSLPNS